MKKINVNLKSMLEKHRITQQELAQRTGIRPNAISNLCRNYVDRLTIEHLEKICTELNIDNINELIQLVEVEDE